MAEYLRMLAAASVPVPPRGTLPCGLVPFLLSDETYRSPAAGVNIQELAYAGTLAARQSEPPQDTSPLVIKAKGHGLFKEDVYPEHDGVVRLVDKAICALTSQSTAAKAWRSLVSPDDRVAVRISTYFNRAVVDAVVRGLLAAGVPAPSITLYRSHVRNWEGKEEKYQAGEGLPGVSIHQGVYGMLYEFIGTRRMRLARVLYECTKLINVACLNSHVLTEVTGALKNHVGSVDKPKLLHESIDFSLALLNNLPVIRDKTKLVILDALRPSLKGHPGFTPESYYLESGVIIAASDPVAADAVGLELIREGRRSRSLGADLPFAERLLKLASKLGVGQSNRKAIRLVEVDSK
jgi:hypothetical protein